MSAITKALVSRAFPRFFHRPASRIICGGVAAWVLVSAVAVSTGAAAPADFTTSFEESETVKPFQDRVEMRDGKPLQQNIKARMSKTLLERVAAVTASSENAPGEGAANAADGDAGSKWLTFQETAWLQYKMSQPAAAVSYSLTSGNDAPERDPRDWRVLGSDDAAQWAVLDTEKEQSFSERGATKTYPLSAPRAFAFYRLEIAANHGGGTIQLADWGLNPAEGGGSAAVSPMNTALGAGPSSGYNMKRRAGFTGLRALRYAGQHTAAGRAYATNRLLDVNIPVGKNTRLTYRIFPELTGNDLQYPSTYTALDLLFTDGTQLSELKPLDVYEISATANGQGTGKILYPNQWNEVRVEVGAVAAGKVIAAIQLSYDNPGGSAKTAFGGWVDDVSVDAEPARIDGASLTNYVDTRRGTNSSSAFSRGSDEPITALPNAFNFLVPLTDALAQSREYSYQEDNDDQNHPRFEGLGVSHEPSPWMGDRNQFSVMPVAGGDAPSGNPKKRALPFRHAHEIAQPDYYGVDLDNGVQAAITPTNRGMVMQFTFPGNAGSVVLDSPTADGNFTIDQNTGAVTGWIDHGSGFIAGQSRMFVSGAFDRAPTSTGLAAGGRPLTKYATFNTGGTQKAVTLRLATSLISLEQASKNLAQEIGAQSFARIREQARAIWNQRLSVILVEGASDTQRVNLYSCLYRLNVYPNAQFENVGTPERPEYKYASPVTKPGGASTATATGAKVVPGKMYVNNGFWDTYRTVWPAYGLFYPEIAAELVDGFTDQYRDGGWVSRWSSPGYANIMTGTSSDVAFADVYVRGVNLVDPLATFEAARKNASTPSSNQNVGRKSLTTSIFLGYTPASQGESVSWAAEGFINDFGVGNMAAALARDSRVPAARRADLRDQSEYYLDRSRNYVKLFDKSVGFFQARDANGKFVVPTDKYNPKTWWGPYTETNGWNFAFHAPHDPQGLVNLYGGKAALEAKLDAFFSTPETSLGTIHEEAEARDGRYGQWGVSNQVSHHIPFMYNAAGAPAKAQKITREVVQRSFAGTEIGQGYSGDEDNGEMSGWFIFNALGLYPVQAGSNQLVVGSPMFQKATVRLPGGKSLVINAPGNDATKVYVQSLSVNGAPYTRTSIDSKIFRTGATLDYQLGDHPSAWGTGPQDGLPSLTEGTEVPNPLADTTGAGLTEAVSKDGEDLTALFDNSSATEVRFKSATPSVTITYKTGKQRPTFYTLTAASTPADPSAWVLEGRNEGSGWTTVDSRREQTFANRRETVPFKIQKPDAFREFRLTVTAGAQAVALSEVELLAH